MAVLSKNASTKHPDAYQPRANTSGAIPQKTPQVPSEVAFRIPSLVCFFILLVLEPKSPLALPTGIFARGCNEHGLWSGGG